MSAKHHYFVSRKFTIAVVLRHDVHGSDNGFSHRAAMLQPVVGTDMRDAQVFRAAIVFQTRLEPIRALSLRLSHEARSP